MRTKDSSDIEAYYRQTLSHYRRWWGLDISKSVHYGIWQDDTTSFAEALQNTNKWIGQKAKIQASDRILDAGCGIGGTAFYLAENYGCQVVGISNSKEHIELAKKSNAEFEKKHLIQFEIQNFQATTFANDSFHVVIAIESSCHAHPKKEFIEEMHRVLKPGGRLLVLDYFTTENSEKNDPSQYLKKWAESWAIEELNSEQNFIDILKATGFNLVEYIDLTREILPSSKRMYRAYWLGMLPSLLYNFIFGASKYSKRHYQSGYFQYQSLMKNLWEYRMVVAIKQ